MRFLQKVSIYHEWKVCVSQYPGPYPLEARWAAALCRGRGRGNTVRTDLQEIAEFQLQKHLQNPGEPGSEVQGDAAWISGVWLDFWGCLCETGQVVFQSQWKGGIAYIPRGYGNLFVSHELKHFVAVLRFYSRSTALTRVCVCLLVLRDIVSERDGYHSRRPEGGKTHSLPVCLELTSLLVSLC